VAFLGLQLLLDPVDVEPADELHQVLPLPVESKTAVHHLVNRFVIRPSANDDSVGGAHHSGAIGAVLAVHEDGRESGVGGRLQEADHVLLLAVPRLYAECVLLIVPIPPGLESARLA